MNPELRLGSTGVYVMALQYALGFPQPDGTFGPQTEMAVKTFQFFHKLPRTGICTQKIWEALRAYAPYKAPCLAPVGLRLPAGGYARRHSSSGRTWAVDIPVPVGWSVASPCNGRVIRVSDITDTANGIGVWIAPTEGPAQSIAMIHLNERSVNVGATVKAEQIIGKSGNTGASKAPHLHLEIFPDGLDPLVCMDWHRGGWYDPD